MPVLRVLKGRAPQKEYPIGAERVVLGRDLKSDVYLEQRDVSRQHVAFERDGEHHFVIDLDSHNHTYVNGKELSPKQRYSLKNNDLIKVCNFIFAFQDDASDSWLDPPTDSVETVEMVARLRDKEESSISAKLDSSSGSWEHRTSINPEAKLKALMRINNDLHDAMGMDAVLNKVLSSLLAIFPEATCALVVFQSATHEDLMPTVARYRGDSTDRATVSRSLIHKVMTTQRGFTVVEEGREVGPSKSVMCVPMLDMTGESLGVIQLIADGGKYLFDRNDLDLLSVVATQISVAIEDSRLHEAALRQRTMQRDLELAREIQLGLLPSESPQVERYTFFDHYAPAREVGGDYYDYVDLREHRLALVVGDVSGKGVPAALLMAKLASEVRVHLSLGLSPVEVMNRVNTSFTERVPEGSFVTMVIALLDWKTHEVEIANAGHMRPLWRTDEGVISIGEDEVGCPLGVIADQRYRSCKVQLTQGDSLVLFSDGISDATNEHNELYGLVRLRQRMDGPSITASELGQRILRDNSGFAGNQPQTDDICLMCLTRQA